MERPVFELRRSRVHAVAGFQHTLIDHDTAPAWQSLDLLPKRLGLPAECQHDLGPQQVESERVRQHVLQPRGLPGPARAEEEERVIRQVVSTCNHRQHIDGKYAGYLYTPWTPSGGAISGLPER